MEKPTPNWENSNAVSNWEINDVFDIYTTKYKKKFKYIGDYKPLFRGNIKSVKKKLQESIKYKYIVFLLPGPHWTSVLIVDDEELFFFDSNSTDKNLFKISKTIELMKKWIPSLKIMKYCEIPLQYDYDNCGILVIHLMAEMLNKNKPYESVINNLIKRSRNKKKYIDYVYSLRKKYFNVSLHE